MNRRRISDVARVAFGLAGLATTAALAREEISTAEATAFARAQTLLPSSAFPAVWLPMQYGTFGTVPALAGLAFVRGRRRLAVAIALSGGAAWVGAKLIKRVVRRERPSGILHDVEIRGKEEGGLGFPSGHAAVSTAMTTVLAPRLGPGPAVGLVAVTAHVSWARMYVGAHLPLDVVGGASMGLAIGGAVNLALGLEDDRAATSRRRHTAPRSQRRRARTSPLRY